MVKYPEDWKVVPLSDVGEVCMCKRVLKSETSPTGDVPFYKIGTFGKTPDAYIRRDLYEAFRRVYSYPKAGEVLISAAGTIGRTVVFDGADSYFQDSNIVWLANNEKLVSNDYLYWCYQVVNWQTEDGGIVARLYNGNFRATKIAVPPLPEQNRIAAVLGNVDKLIDNLSRRIEKKRLVKQGVMQELLTGKKRLPGFEGEWEEKKLGEIGAWLKGQALAKSELVSHGRKACIHYGELFTTYGAVIRSVVSRTDSDAKVLSKAGDILFPISDVTPEGLGRCSAILDDDVILGGDVLALRPLIDVDSAMLSNVINLYKRKIIEQVTGTTVRHVSSTNLLKIVVVIPPTLAEQKAIAKVLGDMDGEIAKLESKLEKYRKLKQGLMGDLLTGKVRLK